jgi:branched-chain amino acid transport system ATP-binding protein
MMLVVQDITKHFGGLSALDGVSFEVPQGTITSLIGPNGAGKTTLFNTISGLLRPTEGAIIFKAIDVTGWSPYRIARIGMGRTFQNVQLFVNLNALENVMAARFCRTHSSFLESLLFWLILDSRVVDLRMVYTDDILCPKSCQESNVAGQYQEFNR